MTLHEVQKLTVALYLWWKKFLSKAHLFIELFVRSLFNLYKQNKNMNSDCHFFSSSYCLLTSLISSLHQISSMKSQIPNHHLLQRKHKNDNVNIVVYWWTLRWCEGRTSLIHLPSRYWFSAPSRNLSGNSYKRVVARSHCEGFFSENWNNVQVFLKFLIPKDYPLVFLLFKIMK